MLVKKASVQELHPDIECFREYIEQTAIELSTEQPPVDSHTAFLIAAQGVVDFVRGLYEQAENGSSDIGLTLRNRLIANSNWPPCPLPDYFVPFAA